EADRALDDLWTAPQNTLEPLDIVGHEQLPVPFISRALRRKIERHDLDALQKYVLPDIELGPVRDRENADAFALVLAGIVEVPQLRPLVLRVPAMIGRPKGKDALLRAALFLVAPRTAERGVETVQVQCLFQPLRLPHVG